MHVCGCLLGGRDARRRPTAGPARGARGARSPSPPRRPRGALYTSASWGIRYKKTSYSYPANVFVSSLISLWSKAVHNLQRRAIDSTAAAAYSRVVSRALNSGKYHTRRAPPPKRNPQRESTPKMIDNCYWPSNLAFIGPHFKALITTLSHWICAFAHPVSTRSLIVLHEWHLKSNKPIL